MRKIIITIFSSIFMISMAYLPLISTSQPEKLKVKTAKAAEAKQEICYYWNKPGETTKHEKCFSDLQEGCNISRGYDVEDYGEANVTQCALTVPTDPNSGIPGTRTTTTSNPPATQNSGDPGNTAATTATTDSTSQNTQLATIGGMCQENEDCAGDLICENGSCQEVTGGTGGIGTPSGGTGGIGTPNGGTGGIGTPSGGTGGVGIPGGGTGGTGVCPPTQLCNPLLSKYDTLCKLLEGILVLVTQIGAMIAVLLIIWTGFKFITAQGNPAKLSAAKKAFLTTIIGTAVLLGASAIAQITIKTVLTITNQSNPGICQI